MRSMILVALLGASLVASDVRDMYESIFISSCLKDAGKKVSVKTTALICVCTWQGIDKKYSDIQLKHIDREAEEGSKELLEFSEYVENRTLMCSNKFL